MTCVPGDYFELRAYCAVGINIFGSGSHGSFRGSWFEAEFRA
jgi:hypothetical protein